MALNIYITIMEVLLLSYFVSDINPLKKTDKNCFKNAQNGSVRIIFMTEQQLRHPPELEIYKVRRGKWKRSALVLEMLYVSLKILGMHSSEQLGTFNSRDCTQKISTSKG